MVYIRGSQAFQPLLIISTSGARDLVLESITCIMGHHLMMAQN